MMGGRARRRSGWTRSGRRALKLGKGRRASGMRAHRAGRPRGLLPHGPAFWRALLPGALVVAPACRLLAAAQECDGAASGRGVIAAIHSRPRCLRYT